MYLKQRPKKPWMECQVHDSTNISIVNVCPVGLELHRLTLEKGSFVYVYICPLKSFAFQLFWGYNHVSQSHPFQGENLHNLFQKNIPPFPISINYFHLLQSQPKSSWHSNLTTRMPIHKEIFRWLHPRPMAPWGRNRFPSHQVGTPPERFRSFLGSQASERKHRQIIPGRPRDPTKINCK